MPNPLINTSSIYVTTESTKATYSAGFNLSSFAVGATDVFQLIGSSSKVIRITRVQITADATAVSAFNIAGVKRTVANTGGTAVAISPTRHDSLDNAPTATIQYYTANPSALGTGTIIRLDATALPAATGTGYPFTPTVWDFGARPATCIVLRGTGESFCVNLQSFAAAQTIPAGLSMFIDIEWTEE